jgi:hypothetical protein
MCSSSNGTRGVSDFVDAVAPRSALVGDVVEELIDELEEEAALLVGQVADLTELAP